MSVVLLGVESYSFRNEERDFVRGCYLLVTDGTLCEPEESTRAGYVVEKVVITGDVSLKVFEQLKTATFPVEVVLEYKKLAKGKTRLVRFTFLSAFYLVV